eukprot:SAG11_NODE_15_length_26319_cov_13.810564_14_plen_69_part_00
MGDDVMQFSNPISEAAEQSPRDGSTIANNTISVDNFDSDHDSDLDDPTVGRPSLRILHMCGIAADLVS